jgi:hydrogenase nickel incorporation protein HypA/HybF
VVALANNHRIVGNPWDLQRFICQLASVLANQTHVKPAGEDCGRYFACDSKSGTSGPAAEEIMHEFGLCDGIVEAVQRRAAGRPVARVRVRVGTLHRVVEGAFQQAFAHAAEGTEAEHAAVELVVIPVSATCLGCGVVVEGNEIIAVCPKCGATDLDLTAGEELILESIEYKAGPSGPNVT